MIHNMTENMARSADKAQIGLERLNETARNMFLSQQSTLTINNILKRCFSFFLGDGLLYVNWTYHAYI